jgi:hypothetical protein
MTTLTQVALRLKSMLETLPGVDQADLDSYLPPIATASIALVIPPFRTQIRVEPWGAARGHLQQSYRVPCEFWVKLDTGNLDQCLQRARDIGLYAAQALMSDPDLNGKVRRTGNFGGDNRPGIEIEIVDRPVAIAGVPYIVVTVLVPIIDYADTA